MFERLILATGVTLVAGVAGLAPTAGADPEVPPPPPLPNVNSYTPVSPVDYTVMDGNWYAFAGPAGVTCVINRQNVSYGCSGPLPGAPDGANLVSGGQVGPPTFSTTERPVFAAAGTPRALPPNTRLSFREISCGIDGSGVVACVNSRDQVGFVVSAAGSYVDDVNPLVDRPSGTPLIPGLPPVMPAMPPG